MESTVPRSSRRRASRDEEVRSPEELEKLIVELEEEMFAAAEDLRFEYAAKLRDEIRDLRHELDRAGAAPEGLARSGCGENAGGARRSSTSGSPMPACSTGWMTARARRASLCCAS